MIETGGTMAPLEAWLCMRGLATLELRMRRHSASARWRSPRTWRGTRRWSASTPRASRRTRSTRSRGACCRKGQAGCSRSRSRGGVEAGQRFCDALELAWIGASLGGTHTLVGHAASTTHRQLDAEARRAAGIADGLIRVSVGLEDAEDLLEDLDRALEKV